MPKNQTTHLGFLLDRSSSMWSKHAGVIAGFNEFVTELSQDDADIRTSLWTFDLHSGEPVVQEVFGDRRLAEVAPLTDETYQPRGSTPLLDATAETITRLRERVRQGDKTMLVVMTDGQENSSRHVSASELASTIAECEGEGWAFIYLGADHDAWGQAANIGLGMVGQSAMFAGTVSGTRSAMRRAATNVKTYHNAASLDSYNKLADEMPTTVEDEGETDSITGGTWTNPEVTAGIKTARRNLKGE